MQSPLRSGQDVPGGREGFPIFIVFFSMTFPGKGHSPWRRDGPGFEIAEGILPGVAGLFTKLGFKGLEHFFCCCMLRSPNLTQLHRYTDWFIVGVRVGKPNMKGGKKTHHWSLDITWQCQVNRLTLPARCEHDMTSGGGNDTACLLS